MNKNITHKMIGQAYIHPKIFLVLVLLLMATAILGYILYYSFGRTIAMSVCYPLQFIILSLLYFYSKKLRTEIRVSNESFALTLPRTLSPFGKDSSEKEYSWANVLNVKLIKAWGLFVIKTNEKEYSFLRVDTTIKNNELYDLLREKMTGTT